MILKTKTATTGGNLTDKGVTTVGREKGRVTACEKKSGNHYPTNLGSPSSDLAGGRIFFCVCIIRKLIIKAFCVRSKSTHTHGKLPVRDNKPSYFMRLSEVCASLDLPRHDENGRGKLASRWLRAGNAWWEFKTDRSIVEQGFQQSFVNLRVFHLYWEEIYYCPTHFFENRDVISLQRCTQLNVRRSVSLVTFQN